MPRGTLEVLLESDRRFFEAGATNDRIGPATLSWMACHTSVPAGCVVHSVDAPSVTRPDDWLDAVEDRVRAGGGLLVRIYLLEPHAPLHGVLERRGYSARTELAYATTRMPPPPIDGVEVQRVLAADDAIWATITKLHRVSGIGSAIHDADPDEWTDLWRRKCEAGDLEAYLITREGEPCGSIGTLTVDDLLRVKNPLVDRRVRRRAVARSAVSLLTASSRARGCTSVGAFVTDGTAGRAMFAASNLQQLGSQLEWLRSVA
jgi:hypothetical protein